jgi:tetratricopeptide (TPR) repeat protein
MVIPAGRCAAPSGFLRVALVLLLAAVAACATPPQRPALTAAPKPVVARPEPPRAPPPFEYEDDALYRLLMAEFAGQRGYLEEATSQYLALATTLRDAELAERATRIAVFSRDDAAALAAGKVWVDLAPDDSDARQILAAMYVRHGDADAALAELQTLLTQDVGESSNRLRMIATLLGREQDRDTALSVLGRLVELHDDDNDALLAYAALAIRAERLEEARTALTRIAERGELSTSVAMAYLAVLQKQERVSEALEWLNQMLASNPQQFGLRLIYARMLAEANRYEEARLQFGILVEEEPDNTDVILALGLLNLQAGRNADAIANFERLLVLDTRVDEAHFYLGQIAEARQEREAAVEHYQAIEGGGNYFAAQLRKALVLSLMGQVDEASIVLDRLTPEDDEQRVDIVRAKCEILIDGGRLDQAMATYDAELQDGAFHSELLYARAMLADKMGAIEVLERDLRTIIEQEPENAQALNALGYTLADRTARYEEALELIKRALKLSPDDFYILDSMGWVLYRLQRFDEAIEYLEQARALRNDPEVAAHLGEVLWIKGERDAARDVWETALRDTPNDKKLLDVIKRLTP